jgi:hypothetical protein
MFSKICAGIAYLAIAFMLYLFAGVVLDARASNYYDIAQMDYSMAKMYLATDVIKSDQWKSDGDEAKEKADNALRLSKKYYGWLFK